MERQDRQTNGLVDRVIPIHSQKTWFVGCKKNTI